jgi:hypothetical protein
MTLDLHLHFQETIDASHHGRPTVVQLVYSRERGQPWYKFDPTFLAWAIQYFSQSALAQFLNVSCPTLQSALLQHGLVQPGKNPFSANIELDSLDQELVPNNDSEQPYNEPDDYQNILLARLASNSNLTNKQMNDLVWNLQTHFQRAGARMMQGLLQRLNYQVSRERIGESLSRIDPVWQVFEKIRVQRQEYKVAGPNAL